MNRNTFYSIPFQDKLHPTHAQRRRAATSRYLLWVVFFVYRWGILLILKKLVKQQFDWVDEHKRDRTKLRGEPGYHGSRKINAIAPAAPLK